MDWVSVRAGRCVVARRKHGSARNLSVFAILKLPAARRGFIGRAVDVPCSSGMHEQLSWIERWIPVHSEASECARSSGDRASASGAESRRFESCRAYLTTPIPARRDRFRQWSIRLMRMAQSPFESVPTRPRSCHPGPVTWSSVPLWSAPPVRGLYQRTS